jgi:hypothetical protein
MQKIIVGRFVSQKGLLSIPVGRIIPAGIFIFDPFPDQTAFGLDFNFCGVIIVPGIVISNLKPLYNEKTS